MINHLKDVLEIEPKVVVKEAFKVVGLEYYGSNSNGEISELWRDFIERMSEINHVKSPGVTLGICEHVKDYDPELSEFSYMTCLEVESFSNVPKKMINKTIPKQKYIVFTHKGSVDNLEDTYRYIYGTYFIKSKFEVMDAPDFELYDQRFSFTDENSEMDIYIPVKFDEDL